MAANPVLVVEVLSPPTSTIDRREKVFAYKQVPSVKEYVIVHQKKEGRLHRKNDEGHWDVTFLGPGDELTLRSIGNVSICIRVDAIYEDVDLPEADRADGSTAQIREDESQAEYDVERHHPCIHEYDLAFDW